MPNHARAAALASQELPLPPPERSLETVSRGLAAAAVKGGRFVALGDGGQAARVAIDGKFDPSGKTREQIFGKLTDQVRREIFGDKDANGSAPPSFAWRAVDLESVRPLYLDGESLTIHEADPKTLASVMRRSIPWDLAKPPRDRGGEPTTPETNELRDKFKRAFRSTLGLKAAGMAPIPEAWGTSGKRQYLVALRVKGFPLALMECDKEEASSCMLTRHCRVEGAKELAPASISGIAVRPSDRLVLIGDAARHRLVAFKFHSCFSVTRTRELLLPGKLKDLSNVSIDQEGRLWMTTRRPDDYQNASLFYWPAGSW